MYIFLRCVQKDYKFMVFFKYWLIIRHLTPIKLNGDVEKLSGCHEYTLLQVFPAYFGKLGFVEFVIVNLEEP